MALLFSYQLLYIHAIDLSGLGIELPDGPFPINVWTKKLITLVLNKDVQADKVSFEKLPVIYIYVFQFIVCFATAFYLHCLFVVTYL